MIAQIVRFRSSLTENEVLELYRSRAPSYRKLEGLIQKHYLRYSTGEYGAVYLWRSEEDLRKFRESELGKSIATTYKTPPGRWEMYAEVSARFVTRHSYFPLQTNFHRGHDTTFTTGIR